LSLYNRYILPTLLNLACGTKPICYQRRKIVPLAEGNVLEIGAGSGLNLPFYDAAKVTKLTCVEPSAELWAKANITGMPFPIQHIQSTAESLEIEEQSLDTIVLSYTLCTINNTTTALSSMRRLLKPDGKLLFCEHGIAPDPSTAKWQRYLRPLWHAIGGGCHLDRPIPKIIEQEGFRIVWMKTMYLPSTPKIIGFNYWGEAKIK
jgi:SAM-dependent methyltransferase